MNRRIVVALLVAACATPPSPPDPTAEIQSMLDASATAWNRGDLDMFISDYARDSMTSFVGAGKVHYGFDWIRDNYAPRFAPGAGRDSLRFVDLQARPLGMDHALATARYVLFREDSVTSSGVFTLVLRREGGRWKILHDHTTADP